MKIWLISLAIATVISLAGLAYFVVFVFQDGCIDSGGYWRGALDGCEGGKGASNADLLSPLAIAIFLGIILGISSALVQVHTLLFKRRH